MSKIDDFIGRLRVGEETRECALAVLEVMPEHEALQVVIEWAKDKGLGGELALAFEEDEEPTG